MVTQVFYLNSDKFPSIANDYSDVKTRAEKLSVNQTKPTQSDSIFTSALEVFPQYRRTATLKDKINNGDYVPALGALGLTLVNIKEDIRDLTSAGKQIYSKFDKTYHYDPLYDRKNYQHSFSFTRGLIGEEYLHKKIADGNKIAEKFYEMNSTIDESKFGKAVNNFFKIEKVNTQKIEKITDKSGRCAHAYRFKSPTLFGEITARAMKRTTKAGIVVAVALEVVKVLTETAKGNNLVDHVENGVTQTVKSSVNVASTTAGIAYGGAIGAKYGGAAGSLIGMGLGAIVGSKVSTKLQNAIL